jgi:AraC-like DNA-binding protein
LSRQFGAGGAPNLKRVGDLLTVLAALHLLGNPGYSPTAVARLLGFSSPSHLRLVVRRVIGIRMEDARGLAERELLARFVRGSARSRR